MIRPAPPQHNHVSILQISVPRPECRKRPIGPLGGHLAACLSPRPGLGELIGRSTPWSSGASKMHPHPHPRPLVSGAERQTDGQTKTGSWASAAHEARLVPFPIKPTVLSSPTTILRSPVAVFHVTFPGLVTRSPSSRYALGLCSAVWRLELASRLTFGRGCNWRYFHVGRTGCNPCTRRSRPSGLRAGPAACCRRGTRHSGYLDIA